MPARACDSSGARSRRSRGADWTWCSRMRRCSGWMITRRCSRDWRRRSSRADSWRCRCPRTTTTCRTVTAHVVAREPRHAAALGGYVREYPLREPEWYAELFARLGFVEQHVREQVYLHRLPGPGGGRGVGQRLAADRLSESPGPRRTMRPTSSTTGSACSPCCPMSARSCTRSSGFCCGGGWAGRGGSRFGRVAAAVTRRLSRWRSVPVWVMTHCQELRSRALEVATAPGSPGDLSGGG